MKIYNYNKETKEFTTSTNATENPLEKGKYLIPANATDKEPLEPKDGFAVCFNEKNKEWEYIEDNRGIAYNIREKVIIDYLGKLKDGITKEPVPMTEYELELKELNEKIQRAMSYLSETDYNFTVDKYSTLTDEKKVELETLREEARQTIRSAEARILELGGN